MTRFQRAMPTIAAALLILVPAGAGALRLAAMPRRATDIWVRLVQPSIPETAKWDPTHARSNLQRLINLSKAPAPHPLKAVLWPEAASPYFLGRDNAARAAVAAIAPEGGYVITGALRASPPYRYPQKIWNSVEAIDPRGTIRGRYDKAHLVPFGEYVPFRDVLPIGKLTPGTIDLSAGPGPQTMVLTGLPPLSPIVCYEAIFPGAVVDEKERPRWILNVTNDAWYGRSSGPYQHFAIARTRAIEEGLPLVRVANNGISGVIGPAGRIVSRTALDDITYLDAQLPEAAAPTFYETAGDWIFLAMLGLAMVPALRRRGQ